LLTGMLIALLVGACSLGLTLAMQHLR
jgi:hypothetical protein